MATITSSTGQMYDGTSTSSLFSVGVNDGRNRVMRYSFVSDAAGASKVSWVLNNNYNSGFGTMPALRWYIGTSSTSHIDAGAKTTQYSGNVTRTTHSDGSTIIFSGSADIVLLPNKTYYLWIFPNTTTYGFYTVSSGEKVVLETEGAAGLVYIDNGSGLQPYQVYIDNGSKFELYMPYIDNGSKFELYTG